MEEWRDVVGLEKLYQVSNLGRIKRLKRIDATNHIWSEKILNTTKLPNGYLVAHISVNRKDRRLLVHRAVAEAFCEKPDDCDIVNHIDNNPANNVASNLEWTTYKGNMQHAAKQGRMSHTRSDEAIKASAKSHQIAVIAIDVDGNEHLFKSQTEAAKELGVSRGHIAAICRGEYGYKQSKGYTFRYADVERQALATPKKVAMDENERREKHRMLMIGNQFSKGRPCSENAKKASIAKLGKVVLQFDTDNNLVAEYPSANSVHKQLGFSVEYPLKKGTLCHGYYWRYKVE